MEKQDGLKSLKEAIESAGHSWTVESNFLSALPEEERKKYLGYTPGPDEPPLEEQESISIFNYAEFLSSDAHTAFGAPAAIDWRNHSGNFVTDIKNQGGCGSCVAFGTLAAVESKVKIQRGVGTAIDLSEAHLFYCIARSQGRMCGGASGGWWPEPAMVACRDIGITDEACYPYTAGDQNCTGRCADWASRALKITNYKRLTSISSMKDWISTQGPVQACFNVYTDFFNYSSGVYKKTSNHLEGGHCVCIIGYDDRQQCWIAKNSWGTGWGETGFFKIGYGQCGIDSEMYGVEAILETLWLRSRKVIGLWANKDQRNAWAYLSGTGWKKISDNNDDGFVNSVTQLAAAKTTNSNVDVYIDNNKITTIYVF
jgi:C1A family cysteine protease